MSEKTARLFRKSNTPKRKRKLHSRLSHQVKRIIRAELIYTLESQT